LNGQIYMDMQDWTAALEHCRETIPSYKRKFPCFSNPDHAFRHIFCTLMLVLVCSYSRREFGGDGSQEHTQVFHHY
jgi:hypothetical protein